QLVGELQFTLGRYPTHGVGDIEAGQGQLALGSIDLDMGAGISGIQRCQLGQVDRYTTDSDALQTIGGADGHATIVDMTAIATGQAALMYGDMALGSDIDRHIRTIDILRYDGRCAVGTAVDGDGQISSVTVTVAVSQGVGEYILQIIAVSESVDVGVIIVQF